MIKIIEAWIISEDDAYINKIYDSIYPTIKTMVKGNQLYRINNFSIEEAEEWTNDIIIILNKVRGRIVVTGFFGFTKTVIKRFLIDRINERRNDQGTIPVLIELSETIINTKEEMDSDIMDATSQKSFTKNNSIQTNLYKHLDSEKENTTFNNLKKWILWNNKKVSDKITTSVLPHTDLSRIGFATLEHSGYDVYANPSSVLTKYDLWCNHNLEDRDYMWTAIDNMVNSKKEDERVSKIEPMVGGVLIDENGYVIASSYRGKNEPKGHCEYNLLEHEIEPKFIKRKYQVAAGLPGAGSMVTELNLRNSVLFVTLEPCAYRNNPKCSCADRIIYSGIKTVFIGLKDPDKTVEGNGIKKMEEAGIKVKYFHQDLLFEIIKAKNKNGEQQNIEFIKSKRKFYLKEQPELFLNAVLEI